MPGREIHRGSIRDIDLGTTPLHRAPTFPGPGFRRAATVPGCGRGKVRRLVCAAVLLLMAFSSMAQPAPKLTSISPDWIQRGKTVEVTLTGENLAGVTGFLFDGDPGLVATNAAMPAMPTTAKVAVESSGGGIRQAPVAAVAGDNRKLVLKVTAANDVSLSPRELRVVGPGGVSNPLNLNVGQWREIARRDGNVTLAEAQPIELPAVISGSISASAQTNFFRFAAKQGDEVVFEVDAARRGSPLDSSLSVLDRDGRLLVRNEDALGLDSLVFFTAPADGEYVLAVRDFRYRGGGEYAYRLTGGVIPYVESIFPYGGPKGKTVEVALHGHNLEGTTKLVLEIAPDAARTQEIRIRTSRGQSNLLPFGVSDGAELADAEPNDDPAKPQAITTPCVINGRIGSEGDIDRFRFRSETDQKLVLDVAAGRFGSKLDALLILSETNGTVLAQNDDASGADARLEFEAKKGGEYIIAVRDLTDRGGDRFGYRLGIRPPSAAAGPSFAARFLPDVPRIHRAGSTRLRCEVTRAGGFEGPVRFVCDGLPAGVYAEALAMPNAPHSGLLMLTATADAPLGSFPLRVSLSGMIGGRRVTMPAEPVSGDRAVRQGYLTVLEATPFSIDATTLGLSLEQEQAGTIEVLTERRDGFNGEIKISAEGFNAGREGVGRSFSGGDAVIKAGEAIGRIALTPKMDSEVGLRTLVIRGEANVGGRQVVTYGRPIPVAVSQYPLILSSTLPRLSLAVLPPGSTSAAGEAETKIRVERRGGFNGDVELVLEGLPEGVRSELPKIPAGVGEVSMKLTSTAQAKVGTNYAVTVVGRAVFNDRNYKARTPAIGLTISVPDSIEVATNGVANRVEGVGAK